MGRLVRYSKRRARVVMIETLRQTGGHVTAVARVFGVQRWTIFHWLKKLEITIEELDAIRAEPGAECLWWRANSDRKRGIRTGIRRADTRYMLALDGESDVSAR